MKKLIAIIIVSLGVSGFTGCSKLSENVTKKPVEITCATATALLHVTTENISKLSTKQVKVVYEVAKDLQPICGKGKEPTLTKVQQDSLNLLIGKLKDIVTSITSKE